MFLNKVIISEKVIFGLLLSLGFQTMAQQPVLKSNTLPIALPAPTSTYGGITQSPAQSNSIKKPKTSTDNTSNEDVEVVIVKSAFAPVNVNIDYLPLYGEYQKTPAQLQDDEAFLKDCDKNFVSRYEASAFFTQMGWDYLAEGSKDMATMRFNMAWLLNKENTEIYWGLGVVSYQKGEYEKAAELMQKGLAINSKNVTLLVDLSTVYIKCFINNKEAKDLQKAYELIDEALLISPDFTNAYMQLSLANLAEDKIDDAWTNFHRGYATDPSAVSTEILDVLLAHKADPKGVFRKPD